MVHVVKRQGALPPAGRPGFDPWCRKFGDFHSLLCVQSGPGVHSASYKMSTLCFFRGKGGRAYLFLVPWLCICRPLYPHPPWAFMACNGDTFSPYWVEMCFTELTPNKSVIHIIALKYFGLIEIQFSGWFQKFCGRQNKILQELCKQTWIQT